MGVTSESGGSGRLGKYVIQHAPGIRITHSCSADRHPSLGKDWHDEFEVLDVFTVLLIFLYRFEHLMEEVLVFLVGLLPRDISPLNLDV